MCVCVCVFICVCVCLCVFVRVCTHEYTNLQHTHSLYQYLCTCSHVFVHM